PLGDPDRQPVRDADPRAVAARARGSASDLARGGDPQVREPAPLRAHDAWSQPREGAFVRASHAGSRRRWRQTAGCTGGRDPEAAGAAGVTEAPPSGARPSLLT